MMELEGLSYPDAVRALAKRSGMEVPEDEQYQSKYRAQERLWALHKEAARFFHSQLYAPVGSAALEYAVGRGMTKNTLTKFGIGYAPDSWDMLVRALTEKGYTQQELIDSGLVTVSRKNGNIFDRFRDRLMFPIIDVRGNIIGFGGRIMNNKDADAAKYLNSPETLIFNKRKNLFGLNYAKKSTLGYLILVEGYMDAIALHQYGFDCAVASLGTSLTEEHATLISRYVEQVVLIYDADEAGQRATRRAIPILEKAGIRVKVLQMKDAKDPDEYLKKFGADKFRILLEDSSNRVEYQLNAIRRKYDISQDDQKVRYVQECADLISTLGSSIQREVYGARIAESAGVAPEAVKIEVGKAYKRRQLQQKKQQEKIDLAPVRNLQPKARTIRYDNMRSAMAEEGAIAMALLDPSVMDEYKTFDGTKFSVPLLGKVYDQLIQMHRQGLEVTLAGLTDLTAEEMSHVVGLCQRREGPLNMEAFHDCISTILKANQASEVSSDEDLMAFRNKLKESKGTK